jgi:L-aminopeptidase/D-esterase-like protein
VPGAIIYDFGGRRFNEIYPDKRLAQAALRAVRPGVFPQGAQGAGRMAMQGGIFGCNAHSGQGGAFRQLGATKIAAFTVVNAYGAVTDRAGRLVACNRAKSWGNLTMTSELLRNLPHSLKADWDAAGSPGAGGTKNTTISLIVTNQKLDYASLQRLAIQVHTSMARAIQPFSTQNDGDTLYAASTQEVDNSELSPLTLTTIASEAMWDAVLASVPDNATSVRPTEKPATVGADKLAAYAGTYEFGAIAAGGFSGLGVEAKVPVVREMHRLRPLLRVKAESGSLSVEAIGKRRVFDFEASRPTPVIPVSNTEFYADARFATRIAFTVDAAGKVSGAVLNPGRWEQKGVKID